MISTDYTKEANKDSLQGTALSRYRLVYWLCNILQNFLSDPINLKDERISRLLNIQDGDASDKVRSLFLVGLPYSKDTRKAGTTPCFMVSAGAANYTNQSVNYIGGLNCSAIGDAGATRREYEKSIVCSIAVITESMPGTLLLCDLIEEFILANADHLTNDSGMLATLKLFGVSDVNSISVGDAGNAKELYQSVIQLQVSGGLACTTSTQGPVFRGLTRRT